MKVKILVLCLILAFIFLVSCEIGFSCDLYIKDIIDIAFGVNEIRFTDAMFAFQISQKNEKLEDFVRQNFRDVENLRIEEDDYYNMYLVFDSKVPIVSLDNIGKLDDIDLFAIVTQKSISKTIEKEVQFGLYMNKNKFENIQNYIEEEFYSTITISDLHLFIDLFNNFLPNLKISLAAIYVNNQPIIYPKDFVLKKDEKLELMLSDVIKDYIYKNDYLLFARLLF